MIEQFQGEYRWLSNFVPVKIVLNGLEFPSVEHAYVSEKYVVDDPRSLDWKRFCTDPNNTSAHVKKKGQSISIRSDWDDVKVDIMKECIKQKFSQEPYRTKLLETGDQYIQEGNMWYDKFWGVCLRTNTGENTLGKLIMEFRDKLMS